MNAKPMNILLADDDTDDRLFFTKALEELSLATQLTFAKDGEELMQFLTESVGTNQTGAQPDVPLPDVIFLDLNMPKKNGFECLVEIKENEKLKHIAVVIFSTSFPSDKEYELNIMNSLLAVGAHVYIRKPGDFSELKKMIEYSLQMATEQKDEKKPIKYILNA